MGDAPRDPRKDEAGALSPSSSGESVLLFRAIFEAIPDPATLWQRDAAGTFRLELVNPAARAATRGRLGEYLGVTADEFFAHMPAIHEFFKEAWESGKPVRRELSYHMRTTGEELWQVGECARVGETHLLAMFRDRTAEKRAAEALRQSEATLRSIFQAAPLGIGCVDRDRRLVWANERLAGMTGYPVAQLTGMPARQLYLSQEEYERVGRVKHPQVRLRGVGGVETVWQRQDGSSFEVLLQSAMLEPGSFDAGLVFTVLDITDRKRAERELRASRERLAQAAALAHVGHWEWDGRHRTVDWSDEVLRMFGFEPGAVQPTPELFLRLIHPEDRSRVRAAVRGALFAGVLGRAEFRFQRAGGGEGIASAVGRAIMGADGRVAGVSGSFQDITELRRAEEERRRLEASLLQAQKLESLGVLAGGIAHDFNNLLMGVLGNVSLALMKVGPASPARSELERIEGAAQRAADLTRQMLAYSGKGKFVVEHLDLAGLVREMVQLLEVSVSKSARLHLDLPADLPDVEGDASQVRQVVMNLITNASEALAPAGGAIQIRAWSRWCDREFLNGCLLGEDLPEGPYVMLEVEDTGCGMDDATLTRMFDPFFSTKFQGRGLGLAAAIGIVRGHRGFARVRSAPERGTSFLVGFPASTATSRVQHKAAESEASGRSRGCVLVVDDEPAVRDTVQRILEWAGFEVWAAHDGQSALQTFRRLADQIDIVLLDLSMPEMDGEEVFKELIGVRPDVRVVLSSGYNEQDAIQRFTTPGLAGFIQKPYRAEALIGKLRAVIALE
ncbi:MAG: PAS domain S-box protein [Thermoanaerobaculaceae bacterium]|nr:PAS domain S-box protein [Thermoanaerobaculaceae bacterium]